MAFGGGGAPRECQRSGRHAPYLLALGFSPRQVLGSLHLLLDHSVLSPARGEVLWPGNAEKRVEEGGPDLAHKAHQPGRMLSRGGRSPTRCRDGSSTKTRTSDRYPGSFSDIQWKKML